MAETSGFFNAEELVDGTYDREYVAEQWADYFKLFIGNGVFVSPTNQLKVRENTGLTVKILPGWAWINGYWYHNDRDLVLNIPINATAQPRTDGIFIQWNSNTREIKAVVGQGRTAVNRTSPYYELKIAEVTVTTGATSITDANITDTRANSDVCGWVTGVVDVIDSSDLFAQFTSIFNTWIGESQDSYDSWINQQETSFNTWKTQQEEDFENWSDTQKSAFDVWFDHMKDQLSTDAAGHLQAEIDDIYEKLEQTAHPVTISVTTPPNKVVYNHGDTFDLTGMVVTALYSDNHTEDITEECSLSPSTLTDDDTSVSISWTWVLQDLSIHYPATQAVTVNKVLSSISMTPPTKTTYIVDEALNLAGCSVTAVYTSGKTANVTASTTFIPPAGTIYTEAQNVTLTASYTENGITKTATTALVWQSPIYGVYWSGTSSPAFTRTDLSANFTDPVPAVNNGNGSSPFDNISPWKDMKRVNDPEAGVLVEIPKFWYKLDTTVGFKLQISPKPTPGFHVSPAHMDRGDGHGERNKVYVGAYHCAARSDMPNADRYKSLSGYYPATVSASDEDIRQNIHNLGQSIWVLDYAMVVTIQMLYLVEYANWDSQAKIGYGVGNNSGNYFYTGACDSMIYHTGTNASNRSSIGSVRYRWIEGLWSNAYNLFDGISKTQDNHIAICINPNDTLNNFSDYKSEAYIDTQITQLEMKLTNPVPSKFTSSVVAGLEWVAVPKELVGMTNEESYDTYVCDYYYSTYSSQVKNMKYYMHGIGGALYAHKTCGLFMLQALQGGTGGYSTRVMKLPND